MEESSFDKPVKLGPGWAMVGSDVGKRDRRESLPKRNLTL